MHLDRQIELAQARVGQEFGQGVEIGVLLGKTREARERQQIIEVTAIALDERHGPRQAHERDLRLRRPCAERAQRRHGTQQIA